MELTAMKQHLDRLYEIFNAGDWSREDRAAYEAVTAFVRASEPKDEAAERVLCKRAAEDIVGWPEPEAAEEVHVLRAQARAELLPRFKEQERLSLAIIADRDAQIAELKRAAEPKDAAAEREHIERAAVHARNYGPDSTALVIDVHKAAELRAQARAEGLWEGYSIGLRARIDTAQREIQRLKDCYAEESSRLLDTRTKLSAAQAEIANQRIELSETVHMSTHDALQTKLTAAQAEIERLKQERDVMAFERDTHMELSQNTAATFHTNGVQSLNKQVSDLTAQLSAAQVEIERLKTLFQNTQGVHVSWVSVQREVETKLSAAQAEIERLQNQVADLAEHDSAGARAYDKLETKLTNLRAAAERHEATSENSGAPRWVEFRAAIEESR